MHAEFRGSLVGRVPSRGERDIVEQAVKQCHRIRWSTTISPPDASGGPLTLNPNLNLNLLEITLTLTIKSKNTMTKANLEH